ncbi:hypothetical protein LEM8419_03047 [Neolewinella maritima]|uniref:Glycosyltransferase 2-like domain-containing protein n=1 Tax=Neolewinella maritima TaxID=1383882 RepID=A0ABN8FA12_9BACT|nr:glycosyltransferase family 2 protein [Neolewinella maritima]CAH1002130.1 hypothetical protein LEM8419_03047 [Neolewinella maritima]
MPSPLISVIIPTYNRPGLLERAVRSVVEQQYTMWELIVVDDGSPNPVSIPPFAGMPAIRVVRQQNSGPGAARKLGAARAQGELLCFLDDDDYYFPQHLQRLATAYQGADRLYVSGMCIESNDGTVQQSSDYSSRQPFLAQYWDRPVSLLPFAIPREVVQAVPLITRPSPIEDFEWIVRLLARYPLTVMAERTVVYVQHQTNRTNLLVRRTDLAARERAITELYALPEVAAQISAVQYLKQLTHQRLHWTRQCLRAGQWSEAGYGMRRSLKHVGSHSLRELVYTLLVAWRTYCSQKRPT